MRVAIPLFARKRTIKFLKTRGEDSSLKQKQLRFQQSFTPLSTARKSGDRTGEKETGTREREKCCVVRNFAWCYKIFGDKLLMSSGVGLPTRLLAPAAISASLLYEKVCTLLECLLDTCRDVGFAYFLTKRAYRRGSSRR